MTKRVTIGLLLMAAAAFFVCYLLFGRGDKTIDHYLLMRGDTEYSGVLYQIPDTSAEVDGASLELHHIYYLAGEEELQFGFSIPTPENADTAKPFELSLNSSMLGELDSEDVLFAVETKGETTYYRAFLTGVSLEPEKAAEVFLAFSDGEQELGVAELLSSSGRMSQVNVSEVDRASVQ